MMVSEGDKTTRGCLYLSRNHACFRSNTMQPMMCLSFKDVVSVEKVSMAMGLREPSSLSLSLFRAPDFLAYPHFLFLS